MSERDDAFEKDVAPEATLAKSSANRESEVRGGLGIDARAMAELKKSLRSSFVPDKGLVAAIQQAQKDTALAASAAKNAEAFRGSLSIDARAMAELQESLRSSFGLDKGLVTAVQKDMALFAAAAKNAAEAFRGGLGIDARAMAELQKSVRGSFGLNKGLVAAVQKDMALAASAAKTAEAVRDGLGIDARALAELQKSLRGSFDLNKGLVAALQHDTALAASAAKNAEAFRGGLGIDARAVAELQKSLRSSFGLDKGLVTAVQKDMALFAAAAKNAAEAFRGGLGIDARAMAELQKSLRSSFGLDKGLVAAIQQAQKDMALAASAAKNAAAVRGGLGIDARAMAELQKSLRSSVALDKELTAAILRSQKSMRTSAALANQTDSGPIEPKAEGLPVRASLIHVSQSRSLLLALKKKAHLIRTIFEIVALVAEFHTCIVNSDLIRSQSALSHDLQNLSVQMQVLSNRVESSVYSHPSQLKRRHRQSHVKPRKRRTRRATKNGRPDRPRS